MSFITDNLITRNYTIRLFLASILLTLSSANFAFDNQGFAQTQAMDPFIKRFGDRKPDGKYALPATFLSYSNAFPFILLVTAGIIIGSMVSSRFGRRATVFMMCIWAICMVPIIVTSRNRSQFLAARCLNSVYIGMEMSVIPVFQSEIVPAAVRGLAVASYQMSFAFGGFVISGICHRTATIPNDWSWRIPFLCYLFVPSVVGGLIWLQPESPRWLVSHGRVDAARVALKKYRKPDHDVEHEIEQIALAVESERNSKSGSYASCFRRANLRRTLIVFGVNFFLQATGSPFSALYGTIIIKSLNTINPFDYTLIANGLQAFVYLVNVFANDHVGRRPLMIGGVAFQAICMYIIAGMGMSRSGDKAIDKVLVTFIMLYTLGFAIGWAPLSYLYSAEIPSQQLRDKTSRMGFCIGIVTQFVVAFTLPYLLYAPYANLGMKVGFIFAPIATVAAIWAFFFLPECKGLKLEQIDLMFEERVSALHSRRWGKQHRTKDISVDTTGHITTESEHEKADDAMEPSDKNGAMYVGEIEQVGRQGHAH